MYSDSQSALSLICNPVLEDMRKHIDVIYNHIRERQDANYVSFSWISGKDNIADMFTKALPRPAFEQHRDSLHLLITGP